jgi:hypothetical protein
VNASLASGLINRNRFNKEMAAVRLLRNKLRKIVRALNVIDRDNNRKRRRVTGNVVAKNVSCCRNAP